MCEYVSVCVRARVCVCVCVSVFVRACVRACVRARVSYMCVWVGRSVDGNVGECA